MPTTPIFGIEYPGSSGHARLWEWFQALAEDVEAALDRPVFRARRTTAQSTTSGSDTAISWDTEDVDSHNGHDLVTNPTRYVIQKAGWYQLTGGIGFANGTTGRRKSEWRKNGAGIDNSNVFFFPNSSGTVTIPARSIIVQCAVNDYIELMAYQESGGSLSTAGAGTSAPSIDIVYLRPA